MGVAGMTGLIGGSLYLRQRHLRSTPLVEAAEQQLRSADAVRALLGSGVTSTAGVVGGYTDPVGGTACVTLPVVSEGGVRAVARVEAEAEWLVLKAHAEARGETPSEPTKAETCRWLLRHLEVELETPTAADSACASAVVLYSLPRNAPLSSWAPSREPSAYPRWLRALLPEPSAVVQAEATPRLVFVGAMAISAHAVVFALLHRRMATEKMLRRAETMLTLPDTPTHVALANRAFELATTAAGPDSAKRMVRHAGAPLYGVADSTRVLGFTSLRNSKEFFFKAERLASSSARTRAHGRGAQQQAMGQDWWLVELAVAPSENFSRRLAKLPDEASEAELLEVMLDVEMQHVPMGMGDRRVVVPR